MAYVLGVDIGATKVGLGLVDDKGQVSQQKEFSSQGYPGPQGLLGNIIEKIQALIKDEEVLGVGVGFCGGVDPISGKLVSSPNLPGWDQVDLGPILKQALKMDVWVENDANVAALGEWTYGSGKELDSFFYLTISTGIGGGYIHQGSLWRGHAGYGSEVGHTIINAQGPRCACGNRGCWEALASGKSIARQAQNLLVDYPGSSLAGSETLTSKEIFKAYMAGDPLARKIVEAAIAWHGIGIYNIAMSLNPAVLALGGGVGLSYDWFIDKVRKSAQSHQTQTSQLPRLVRAYLGSEVGIIGGGALAWAGLKNRG